MFGIHLAVWIFGLRNWCEEHESVQEKDEECVLEENIEAQFTSACSYLSKLVGEIRISPEDRLYFYARYKQATCGRPDSKDRPGLFDARSRKKYNCWLELGEMSSKEAMTQYINRLKELNVGWEPLKGYTLGNGIKPSKMEVNADSSETDSSNLNAEQAKWFNALYADNTQRLAELLVTHGLVLIEERDENQLTALHWAADRGKIELVKFLIDAGADMNAQDYSGQTPLHYATSCSHRLVVELLLRNGADVTIADFEGNCALDISTDSAVRQLLSGALSSYNHHS